MPATKTADKKEPERQVERKGDVAKVGNLTKPLELRFGQDGNA
jgi:hypothetical protein